MFNKMIFAIAAALISAPSFAEQEPPKATCELRLVSNAGAGEIFMSIITNNEEECLAKSDQSVEAKYRNEGGHIISQRGGKGPRQ